MINRIVLPLILVSFSFLLTNCSNSPSTQEKPIRDYLSLDTTMFPFRMQYPAESKIVLRKNEPEALWFDIVYPARKSTIYCTYFPVRGNFRTYDEDVRRFVYRHTVVATAIKEQAFSLPEKKLYALIFDIKGEVASPVQFLITDSVSHFLRGALYYDNTAYSDSLALSTADIREDIIHLIQTLEWR
ncbi:MAG TPA: gliding motility lipoprotein GldD [Bacteroidales bacterium]